MAVYDKPLFVNSTGTGSKALGAGDEAVFPGDVTFTSGKTVDFTGTTVSGLIVGAAYVTDATGTAGFTTTAGVWTSSGITDLTFQGSGVVSLGSTGTNQVSLGNDNAALTFTGPGALSLSGVTDLTLHNSGNASFGSVGGGDTTLTDAVGSVTLDGSGGLSTASLTTVVISGSGNSSFGTTSTGTLSLRSATGTSRWGDGTGYLQFGGSGAVTSSGITTFGLSGSGAMTIGTTSTGTLAVRSNTGTATFGDAVGSWVFTGSGGLSTNNVTTVDLDGSGAIQINSSGGAIQIGNDAVSQNIDIGTAGTRNISIGSTAATIFVKNSALFSQGTNAAAICIQQQKTAKVALTVGKVLAYATGADAGKVLLADANGGTANLKNPVGVCTFPASADGDPTAVASVLEVPVEMDTAPAASSVGATVFLSETAGLGTLTPPATAGSDVWALGTLAFANGIDTVCRVQWLPGYRYTA